MNTQINDNFKKSSTLFGLGNKLINFINIYNSGKFPKISMISGKKGIGKSTLINHFLYFIFDKKNYDIDKFSLNPSTNYYTQYELGVFSNIIYLSGDNFKNIKIEDIRNLKSNLLKSSLNNSKRFIILDDIELFNINSLNALLKLIEEPTVNNFFILIDNKSRPILETIQSRSIIFKILINDETRINIIENLIKKRAINPIIDYKALDITPGNFILYNQICEEEEISLGDNLVVNIEKLLNSYKKKKNISLINLALFLTDYHFLNNIRLKKNIDKIVEKKQFVQSNLNKFVTFNLNQKSLLNAINEKIING